MEASVIVNYAISLITVSVAAVQTYRNYKLKIYVKSEAMQRYRSTGILLGSLQRCLSNLGGGNIVDAKIDAGKAEGITQSLFQDSIKNIYHHTEYNQKKIEEWIKMSKIEAMHRTDFAKYAEK